jgi:hypothetical protein
MCLTKATGFYIETVFAGWVADLQYPCQHEMRKFWRKSAAKINKGGMRVEWHLLKRMLHQ